MKIIAEHSTAARLTQPAGHMLASLFPRSDLRNAPQPEGLTNMLTSHDACFVVEALMRAWPN